MVDEYEAPGRENFISEEDASFAEKFNAKRQELQVTKPIAIFEADIAAATATGDQVAVARAKAVLNAFHLRIAIKNRDQLQDLVDKTRLSISKLADTASRHEKELVEDRKKLDVLLAQEQTRAKAVDKGKTATVEAETPVTSRLAGNMTIKPSEAKGGSALWKNIIYNKETLMAETLKKKAELEPKLVQYQEAAADAKTIAANYETDRKALLKITGTEVPAPAPIEPSEDDYDKIAAEVKAELGITKTMEEYDVDARNIIERFLDSQFRYNPDLHVRAAHKPNYKYFTDAAKVKADARGDTDFSAPSGRGQGAAYDPRSIIPPNDTFFRWQRYFENNYEELRQATDDIYCERSDIESAIIPLTICENMDKFNEFKRKYADEFDLEVMAANFGNWTFTAPFEPNRDQRDFYTESTEILKQIMDRSRDDQRYGAKLMKDRAQKKKAADVKKHGEHAASFGDYKRATMPNTELEKHGARHIDDLPDNGGSALLHANLPRDVADSSNTEVEVGVHVIKPHISGNRRRIRGETDQWKINVPAEKLDKDNVTGVNIKENKERQEKAESSKK
jgi:hypothetical protein